MRPNHARLLFGFFAGLLMHGLSVPVHAQNCAPQSSDASTLAGMGVTSIRLTSSTVSSSDLGSAAGMWNNTCDISNTLNHPEIRTSGTGSANINVVLHAGSTNTTHCPGASGCGCTDLIWPDGSGGVADGTIHLFETASANGFDCTTIVPETIAHEIGHNLGLDNATDLTACAGRVMAAPVSTTAVEAGDCSVTDQIWTIPNEPNGGGGGGGGGCLTFKGKEL